MTSKEYENNRDLEPEKEIDGPIGVIFDLDGTLSDSLNLLFEVTPSVAQDFGVEISEKQKQIMDELVLDAMCGGKSGKPSLLIKLFFSVLGYKKRLLYITILLKIAKLIGISRLKRPSFMMRVQEEFKRQAPHIPLFDGVEQALKKLRGKYDHGIKMGIVSTTNTDEIFHRFEENPKFLKLFGDESNIVGRDKVKEIKPSPEGILILSEKWEIPPERLIMIGDTKADIFAGNAVGALTVGVSTGPFVPEELKQFEPDFVFTSVVEFINNFDVIIGRF